MHEGHHPNYLAVWIGLMVLAAGSVVVSQMNLPISAAVVVVYGVAVVKAVMVGLYFMHLRTEGPVIIALVTVPLALFVILTIALLPDFVFASSA